MVFELVDITFLIARWCLIFQLILQVDKRRNFEFLVYSLGTKDAIESTQYLSCEPVQWWKFTQSSILLLRRENQADYSLHSRFSYIGLMFSNLHKVDNHKASRIEQHRSSKGHSWVRYSFFLRSFLERHNMDFHKLFWVYHLIHIGYLAQNQQF